MAEDEYIAMSHVLHETIPIQNLIKEIHCIFDLPNPMTMTDFNITLCIFRGWPERTKPLVAA
jgi:hypothetical protein